MEIPYVPHQNEPGLLPGEICKLCWKSKRASLCLPSSRNCVPRPMRESNLIFWSTSTSAWRFSATGRHKHLKTASSRHSLPCSQEAELG